MKTVIKHFQHFSMPIPNFCDTPLSRAAIYNWFKKLEDRVSDAPSKSFQRCMGLEVVGELVEIVALTAHHDVLLSSLTVGITQLWGVWL